MYDTLKFFILYVKENVAQLTETRVVGCRLKKRWDMTSEMVRCCCEYRKTYPGINEVVKGKTGHGTYQSTPRLTPIRSSLSGP
jgi:hypothetical protein